MAQIGGKVNGSSGEEKLTTIIHRRTRFFGARALSKPAKPDKIVGVHKFISYWNSFYELDFEQRAHRGEGARRVASNT